MAMIQKIRRNWWLLVLPLALALLAFVMMDMMSGGGSGVSVFSNPNLMAEVNGEKVYADEFSRRLNIAYGNSQGDRNQQVSSLWNFYLEDIILRQEAEELGVGVSKDELDDLMYGTNLSPVMNQLFRDPNTGQVNRDLINQYRTAIENGELDPQTQGFWNHQQYVIIKERLKEKVNNIAAKGMYIPTWQAEMIATDQNNKIDFAYVKVPFDVIDETEIALSDADYSAYLKEKQKEYTLEEEARRVSYIIFDVNPSAADSALVYNNMDSLARMLLDPTANDTLIIEANSGVIDPSFSKKDVIPASIADTVFNMAVGGVYGPYLEEGAYKVLKLVDRKPMPDSIRARHILIKADPTNQPVVNQAFSTIDSLKTLIETGVASFDSLAVQFSQDGSAAKGGDLGFVGFNTPYVKPFNDAVVNGEIGELQIVGTQFGVHLIEVTEKQYINNEPGVKLAQVQEPIIPTEATRAQVEDVALTILESSTTIADLQAAVAQNEALSLETSPDLKATDYFIPGLGGGQSTRDIIRWAFGNVVEIGEPAIGEVSPELYSYQDQELYYTNKYVLVALETIRFPGKPKLDQVKSLIEPEVLKEKKSQMIVEQMGTSTNLASLAAQFGVAQDTAKGVSFTSAYITDVGAEPEVVAKAFKLDLNQASPPIVGQTGVFVVMPVYKPAATAPTNVPQVRRTQLSSLQGQVRSRLLNALKKQAEVENNLSRFF